MIGFDASLLGSINALPNYVAYYNLPTKGATSTGIVFAIYQVGPAFFFHLDTIDIEHRLISMARWDKW